MNWESINQSTQTPYEQMGDFRMIWIRYGGLDFRRDDLYEKRVSMNIYSSNYPLSSLIASIAFAYVISDAIWKGIW